MSNGVSFDLHRNSLIEIEGSIEHNSKRSNPLMGIDNAL